MTTATAKQPTAKHSEGPWTYNYIGMNGRSTGFGCGYGKSQVINADDVAIAGVAAIEPPGEPMYEKGGLSKATIGSACD